MLGVYYLSYYPETPKRGYWDMCMLDDLLAGDLAKPFGWVDMREVTSLDDCDHAIVVIPARYHADDVMRINAETAHLSGVIYMLVGDEENAFPHAELSHPNRQVWVMSPNPAKHMNGERHLGCGYTPHVRDRDRTFVAKDKDWVFAGQITHPRRERWAEKLREMIEHGSKGVLLETKGFTEGYEPDEYVRMMQRGKCVPAPSGPLHPDTFRLFEALELGAVPIADVQLDGGLDKTYWAWFFGYGPPFPTVPDVQSLPGYIGYVQDNWPHLNNKVFAWWQQYKRNLAYQLRDDVSETFGLASDGLPLTVVIPSSPIHTHPDTSVIEETVSTIRTHLSDVEILITCDGVRQEQEHLRDQYEEYITRLLHLCNDHWDNVTPFVHDEHLHQAEMLKRVLSEIHTTQLMYVEHDTPITPDCDIPFELICDAVESGRANQIRLYHEAAIPKEHMGLMMNRTFDNALPLQETFQWSQRPHVASVAFYRRLLDTYFPPGSKTMLEDVLHSPLQVAVRTDGRPGWNQWRCYLYSPEGPNMKRSYHLDGRGDEPKYENVVT